MKLFALFLVTLVFANGAAGQARKNSIPPELIGKWYASEMSNTTYSDRATGENNTASGANASLEFKTDGSYVFARFARAQVYGCETTIYNYNPGKFRVFGETIYFLPTDDELTYKSSCNPSLNSVKHTPPVKSSNQFVFKIETDITYLCFADDKDKEACYRRMEK